MGQLKLHFSADLPHQRAAIEAICDLFHGQETGRSPFTISESAAQLAAPLTGLANRLTLSPEQLGANLRAVQLRNGLPLSGDPNPDDLNFTVEMETGTGKTYVYLRTIYELNKRYGFTKFVVVVPSIAIKEGVNKTLSITADHFRALYEGTPLHYFRYDSARLGEVRNFAHSTGIEVMITTVGAINKRETGRIYQDSEQTGGDAPIDLIRQTSPILIVDEPQSVDGGLQGAGRQALRAMQPLFTLRYSATHVDKHHMVYKLDAVDAYQAGLVKQIAVAGGSIENAHGRPYVRLESISTRKNDFSATIEVDVAGSGGSVRRATKSVQPGDLLDQVTGRAMYAGLQIGEVSKAKGAEFIHVYGGGVDVYLRPGEAYGDIPAVERARHLIRKTIREHLDKELELRPKGIKVLSLFFLERVEHYRVYGTDGQPRNGDYALVFEEEYRRLKRHPRFQTLLAGADLESEAEQVHGGYFAQDRKGVVRDVTEKGREGVEAERAYDLIMRDKEKLLSLDTPLKFIFSHSALREGWDNPNVFQICTLREMGTDRQRRQTIGRGLRLAVDRNGERVSGSDVNSLTVIATESYEQFAEELQKEIEQETGIRFGYIAPHQFAGLPAPGTGGEPIGPEAAQRLYGYLQDEGYLDRGGKIDAAALKAATEADAFVLPDEFAVLAPDVSALLNKRAAGVEVKNKDERRLVRVRKRIYESAEFRELWERIKYKTTYRVHFDPEQLIADCVRGLKEARPVSPARMYWRKAQLTLGDGGLGTLAETTTSPELVDQGDIPLPDVLSELADRTQLTRRSIHCIVADSGRIADFRRNPQEFLEIATAVITARKQTALVDGVRYIRLGEHDYYAQELFLDEAGHGYLGRNLLPAENCVYEEVRYESGTEKNFVLAMEREEEVRAYAKLPSWFKIPTPLGPYSPDWAVVRETPDGMRHLYLVIETKGTQQPELLRPEEAGKIRCGRRHFAALGTGVTLSQASDWSDVDSGELTT
jgi:type III restriction enzyme